LTHRHHSIASHGANESKPQRVLYPRSNFETTMSMHKILYCTREFPVNRTAQSTDWMARAHTAREVGIGKHTQGSAAAAEKYRTSALRPPRHITPDTRLPPRTWIRRSNSNLTLNLYRQLNLLILTLTTHRNPKSILTQILTLTLSVT